jgi:hypothetical protein
MDTRIPLAVQPLDFGGSLTSGLQAGMLQRQAQRQNALGQLYQTQGPQIMAGDPQALNALARIDPTAGMQMQAQQFNMTQARQQAQQATTEAAQRLSADQLTTETAKAERVLAGAVPLYARAQSGDPMAKQQLTQYLQSHGIPATPENVDQLMFQSQTVVETLKAFQGMQPKPTEPLSPQGKLEADLKSGAITQDQYSLAQKPDPLVSINTGDNSNAFVKKADEIAALRMSDIIESGQGAQQMVGDLGALAEIAKGLETGLPTQIMTKLGPYAEAIGIDMAGLGAAQAYDAITARLAPQLRTPGVGASSDFDAKQFLKSIPSLANNPEGNAIIAATLMSIQQAKIAASDIAAGAMRQEYTWQEADKKIAALSNPFDAFNKFKGKGEKAGSASGLSDEDMKYLMDTGQ